MHIRRPFNTFLSHPKPIAEDMFEAYPNEMDIKWGIYKYKSTASSLEDL